MCEKPLEQYLLHTEPSMLPIYIVNLILSLQTGFLSFSRNWISNPNSQEKEYGLSYQSGVLEKEQAAVAKLTLWVGRTVPRREWVAEGSIWNHTNREGRKFFTKVKSWESLCSLCNCLYGLCKDGFSCVEKKVTHLGGEGHREEVREPITTERFQCSRKKTGSCIYTMGSNPCDSVKCCGLNCVPPKFMCWSPNIYLEIRRLQR